jgi:hypothetical protein
LRSSSSASTILGPCSWALLRTNATVLETVAGSSLSCLFGFSSASFWSSGAATSALLLQYCQCKGSDKERGRKIEIKNGGEIFGFWFFVFTKNGTFSRNLCSQTTSLRKLVFKNSSLKTSFWTPG